MSQKPPEPAKESLTSTSKTEDSKRNFVREVMKMNGGEKILECIQCGSCAGGCPARFAMDYSPMQLIKMITLGMKTEVMSSSTIWLCSTCHTCVTRCPREVDFPSLAMSLRNSAMNLWKVKNTNKKFHESYYDIVCKYGRNYEPELLFNVLDKTNFNELRSTANLGILMLKRGKIRLKAPKTEQVPWIKVFIDKTAGSGSQ